MRNHTITELNDKQLDAICGGTYFTWLCNNPGGSSGGGGGNAPVPVANPVFQNIYIRPTIIVNNNSSIIDLSNTTINGTLIIGVSQNIIN